MTDATSTPASGAANESTPTAHRGPLTCVLDLFSSIWLGVTLLTILFVYSSIGSALIFVRESRLFEMSEFEWFHWWPFNFLIFLICLNIIVATLRRIPLTTLRLGVWMIHSGIIILAIGSVYYFSTKFEGDTPVTRRQLLIMVPDEQPTSIPVMPGNEAQLGDYNFHIRDVDPHWELRSGEDAGKRAYSVSVLVNPPDGDRFIRQLIANYPQYTEDILFTDDPQQPMSRAVNEIGEPIARPDVQLALDHEPQDEMYLMNSAALYIREVGERKWIERPIRTGPLKFHEHIQRLIAPLTNAVDQPINPMPRYQDYIADAGDIWARDPASITPRPLDVRIPPVSDDDPLADVDLRMTSYTRFADFETRSVRGGDELNPVAQISLRRSDGQSIQHRLEAFDPQASRSDNGTVAMRWIDAESEFDALSDVRPPRLTLRATNEAGQTVETEISITETLEDNPDLDYTEIENTDYAVRVEAYHDNLSIGPENRTVSFASLDVRRGETQYRRWVFDEDRLTRDMPIDAEQGFDPDQMLPTDENLTVTYHPGEQPAPLTIVAGPEPQQLRAILMIGGRQRAIDLEVGHDVPLAENLSLRIEQYAAYTHKQRRPRLLPRHERDRDFQNRLSMIQVELPEHLVVDDESGGGTRPWLAFHQYPFMDVNHTLVRNPYRPTQVTLSDGRQVEMMFSRQRRELPHTILLDTFEIVPRIGGYTGESSSIRDWRSVLRFVTDDGRMTDRYRVSTNDPISFQNHWYYQSAWDPPIEPQRDGPGAVRSRGLNYTVLGVANRNGVYIQLFGCAVAVTGMIYTFYVKPIIKRRRQQAVYAHLAAGTEAPPHNGPGEHQARTAAGDDRQETSA